jgi:hypothetical protein
VRAAEIANRAEEVELHASSSEARGRTWRASDAGRVRGARRRQPSSRGRAEAARVASGPRRADWAPAGRRRKLKRANRQCHSVLTPFRPPIDPSDLIRGKRIVGTWGGETRPDEDIPRYVRWFAEGRLPLAELITREYRLDDVNAALADMEHGRVNRALLKMAA